MSPVGRDAKAAELLKEVLCDVPDNDLVERVVKELQLRVGSFSTTFGGLSPAERLMLAWLAEAQQQGWA